MSKTSIASAPCRQTQRGAALIIGLIFLVLLTLIGVTAMQSTTMEEKMAGNMRERDRAFQGAESALRSAELAVMGQSPWAFTASCANGLCALGSAPDWSTYAWNGSQDMTTATPIPISTAVPPLDLPSGGGAQGPRSTSTGCASASTSVTVGAGMFVSSRATAWVSQSRMRAAGAAALGKGRPTGRMLQRPPWPA